MGQINATDLIGDEVERVRGVEYNGRNIEVKILLSYPEAIGFVDYVVDSCFDDDTGEYRPEILDFALRFATIESYTNINLPDKYGEAYDFLYSIDDLLFSIKEVISKTQFTSIMDAIDNKINSIVNSHASEMMAKMNDLYNEVFSLIDTLDKQLDGISDDDMKKLVEAMTETGFDTNKLVKSYIESKES